MHEKAILRRRWLSALSIIIIPLLIWLWISWPSLRSLRVTFMDVGQGDAALLITPSGRTVLIDGGGRPGENAADAVGPKVVEPVLRRNRVNRIDLLVLTHPHDDHLKGLLPVLRDFRVDKVLDPGIPHGSAGYLAFLSTIRDRHIEYHRALRGQRMDFRDGVTAEVFHPGRPMMENTRDDVNNNSVVMRFSYGKWKILFTGDAAEEAEGEILASGINPESDVMKVGHHGSSTSTSDEWLDAVHPKIAVISVGRRNAFGHPAPSTLERLQRHGVRVLRTDQSGAVTLTLREESRRIAIHTGRGSD